MGTDALRSLLTGARATPTIAFLLLGTGSHTCAIGGANPVAAAVTLLLGLARNAIAI